MRILHRRTLDRARAPESIPVLLPLELAAGFASDTSLGEPRPPRAEGAFGRASKIVGLMRRMGGVLLLAALAHPHNGGGGRRRAAATTNRMALTWGSLGSGTRYYVQTSTNLLTWTAATNTTATNVSLAFIGDKARMFRLSASNAPPQSATWPGPKSRRPT